MVRSEYRLNIWAVAAILLGILLLASVTYIIVSKYKEFRVERENALIMRGYQYAIFKIIGEAQTCAPITLEAGNKSVSLAPLNCKPPEKESDSKASIVSDSGFLEGLNGSLF